MPGDLLIRIHSPEFKAMSERVLEVTRLTSRLNVLPFEDEGGKAALFEQILGNPLPPKVTIYPPFYTDHGLNLDLRRTSSSTRAAHSWTMPASGSRSGP